MRTIHASVLIWACAAGPVAASDLRLEPAFLQNHGQTDERVLFQKRGGAPAWLVADGFHFAFGRPSGERVVSVLFEGGEPVGVAGESVLDGVAHELIGPDPARWRTGLRRYGGVRYRSVWPGVDVVVRVGSGPSGVLMYDVECASLHDLERARFRVVGIDGASLGLDGQLWAETRSGVVRQSTPRAFAVASDGSRRAIDARVRPLGESRFGFEVLGVDADALLVVDPTIDYATYLGGWLQEEVRDIAVDADGFVHATGFTWSGNFPVTSGAADTTYGNHMGDAFIARLAPGGGGFAWVTYLGGGERDQADAIALDAEGDVYVAGLTRSHGFPASPGAFDTNKSSQNDAFVAKLDRTGSFFEWATYLGGQGDDAALDIALWPNGDVVVLGQTTAADFPVSATAHDGTANGGQDVFLSRFSNDGANLLYSTMLGGAVDEYAAGLIVDADGSILVTGSTRSPDFPVTSGAFDESYSSLDDGFVTRFTPQGALAASTFVGAPDFFEIGGHDLPSGIGVRADGSVVICGATDSKDFPLTPGAFDIVYKLGYDAFVTALSPGLDGLHFSTFLGGTGDEVGHALQIGRADRVHVVGETTSSDFPLTPDAPSSMTYDGVDAFVATVSADGKTLLLGSYLGGESDDVALAAAIDDDEGLVLGGYTTGSFPTTHDAFSDTFGGGPSDGILARIDLCGGLIEEYGDACPGSGGIAPALAAVGCPAPGSLVRLCVEDGLGGAAGLLLVGSGDGVVPIVPGCAIQVAPLTPIVVPLVLSGGGQGAGKTCIQGIVPPDAASGAIYFQVLLGDPQASGGVASTNPLSVEVPP